MRRVLAWLLRKTFGVDLDEGARWRREACLRDRTAYGVFPFARDDH